MAKQALTTAEEYSKAFTSMQMVKTALAESADSLVRVAVGLEQGLSIAS
jgi:hypothetical protein